MTTTTTTALAPVLVAPSLVALVAASGLPPAARAAAAAEARREITYGDREVRAATRRALGVRRLTPAQAAGADAIETLSRARMARDGRDLRSFAVPDWRPGQSPEQAAKTAVARRASRLAALRLQSVEDAARSCGYRRASSRWAGGHHDVVVRLLPPTEAPTARGSSARVWSANGKWSGLDSVLHLSVPADWRVTVQRRGLAVIDGLLTLRAIELPLDAGVADGCDAYAAVVVRQARGFDLRAVDCVILRDRATGTAGHGSSVRSCALALRRRLEADADEAARIAALPPLLPSPLESALHRHPGLVVTYSDAREAGLCGVGITDWIARVGLPEGTRELPAARALELAQRDAGRSGLVARAVLAAAARADGECHNVACP